MVRCVTYDWYNWVGRVEDACSDWSRAGFVVSFRPQHPLLFRALVGEPNL